MKTSVVLCTYNRSQSLAKALDSVALSRLPESFEWDVLVVDNNSNDDTHTVVESYSRRFPGRFRYLFEARQGKSFALNLAIREAKAEVLAFMDDDVEVDRDWLCNLTKVLFDERWSGAGGRILPEKGFAPPHWMETNGRYALAPLAFFDLGSEAGELTEAPFGTNMAFRKEMFSKYGDFRIDLGPQPGSEIRNEDTEFGSRLLAAGERFWYVPAAVVYHSIPPKRVQKSYFLAWWFDKARAEIRQDGVPRGTKLCAAGVPVSLLCRLCLWILRWMFSFNSRRRFSSKLNVWRIMGMIRECRHNFITKSQTPEMLATDIVSTSPPPRD